MGAMKPSLLILGLLSVATFLTGCVGVGSNTQQGAFGGAAVGALAGAIIGNNSGHRNAASGAVIGGIAGAALGGTIGNSLDHQHGTLYTSEKQATTQVVVAQPPTTPPPPARVNRPRPTGRTAIWVEGHWLYDGRGAYVWIPGSWTTPPPRYRYYVAPHWSRHHRGYVYVQGYWR